MPKAKILIPLVLLVGLAPCSLWAGLNVFPADGPPPKLNVEPPKPLEYKVQKGDTLAVIAKKFSVPAKDLLAANGLADAKKLKAGQTLKIPGKTAPAAAPVAAAPAAVAASPAPVAAAPAPAALPEPKLMAGDKSLAKDRKGGKKGEPVDPGVEQQVAPVAGKKGKKGKLEPAPAPAPTIEVDDKLRSSFGKTGIVTNNTNVPQPIREEFMRYAVKWVDELDRLGVGTINNKKIRQVGNQWEATYRIIIRESLGSEVKKVDYEHTPYVGHITYIQRVYTSVGPTKQAALAGPYTAKDEAIREIFSYSGKDKAWR